MNSAFSTRCFKTRAIPLIALALALLPATPTMATVVYHTVALTGDPAPGFDPPATFWAFTTALNHSIMAPRLDEDGNVAFIAIIAPGQPGASSGIWQERNGVLSLAVRTGVQVPGMPAGVTFAGVPNEYIPFPPNVRDGRIAFQGLLAGPGIHSGNDDSEWIHDVNGLQLVAREGDPAPDTTVNFGLVHQPVICDDGRVVLVGSLNGPGINNDNNEAIWSNLGGSLHVILREGEPAPGAPEGVVLGLGVFAHTAAFNDLAVSHAGRTVVQANLLGPGVDAFNDEAILVENPQSGAWHMIARENDDAPGFPPGSDFGGGSVTAQFIFLATNALGHVSFSARVGGAGNTNLSLFSNHRGTLEPIIVPGAPAPGGGVFGAFGAPILNDAGHIAIKAAVAGSGFGVFWDQNGELEPAVLPGAISTDGSTITGVDFIAGYSASGWLAVAGPLNDPIIGHKYGIHLISPAGELHKVVTTSDLFHVRGDGTDIREVIRVVHGGVSEAGAVVFRLDFADESSGHFTARVATFATGDLNCDGAINAQDVNPFALALVDPAAYAQQFPTCNLQLADANSDGNVNAGDVPPFVALLLP